MTENSTMAVVSEVDLRKEFEAYLRLRPYLGRCLKLNHSINNSLAGIMGNAEFLCDERENLTSEQREFARQILECVDRIRDSIEELRENHLTPEAARDLKLLADTLETPVTSD